MRGGDATVPGPVGIVGLGVMGGSLARALTLRGVEVRGFSPVGDEARAARHAGAVTEICGSIAESARGVEWWIVATPLSALPAVFEAGAAGDPPRVMDLASLQAPARAAAAAAGLGGVHVSAHPMAGSERSGFGASDPELYEGARVWLTADREEDVRLDDAVAFWRAVGARPQWIDAREHDRRMAVVSHLPQLTANVLARALSEAGAHPDDLGPGGRDMTRLAASAPEMWADLLAESAPDVAPLLRAMAARFEGLAAALEAGDRPRWTRVLEESRAWRRT